MRLIDADALLEKLKKNHDFFVDAYGGFSNLPRNDKSRVDEITHCIAEVVNAPTIEAEPVKHGRWIRNNIDHPMFAICSECETVWYNEYNYCPHCGARMDGGEAE